MVDYGYFTLFPSRIYAKYPKTESKRLGGVVAFVLPTLYDGYGQNVVEMPPARVRMPYIRCRLSIRLVRGTVLSPSTNPVCTDSEAGSYGSHQLLIPRV